MSDALSLLATIDALNRQIADERSRYAKRICEVEDQNIELQKAVISAANRLDFLESERENLILSTQNKIEEAAALSSRLDSIRAIVLPAAVSSNSRDHVSAICELYKLFGEVVERHEPVMGFPAESEAEELRRKNSFFPPLMPKSE